MSEPLHVLLRVKQLKEQRAFRAMHAKRGQVSAAIAAMNEARESERANAATLSSREDGIYSRIMSRIVAVGEIDDAKARVKHLETEHNKFVDAVERAVHVHARLEKELAEAVARYHAAVRTKDKYVALTEALSAEQRSELAHREEAEVEDLFTNRRRKSA